MNDQEIEQKLQAQSVAPRVTPADVEQDVAEEHYFTAEQGVYAAALDRALAQSGIIHAEDAAPPAGSLARLTFCVLVLRNGFVVTGESACASPENFDPEIGRQIARQNAVAKIWPLLGYQLRTKLAAASPAGK